MIKNLYKKYKIYGWKKFVLYAICEIRHKLYAQLIKGSYSQKGEDLMIDKTIKFQKRGFYVDVGAYDPHRFNNTKRFYLKGWRGINIEPNLKNYKKFLKDRKEDINLNFGIGGEEGDIPFYEFFPDTLSTFSKKMKEKYIIMGYKLIKIHQIPIVKLSTILEKYLKAEKIDFLSVDTEGYDLEVLKSNDWNKYKPRLIIIESSECDSDSKKSDVKIHNFLEEKGYEKLFDNDLNSIYSLRK